MSAKTKTPIYQINKNVVDRIWIERMRQKDLFKIGKLTFACDSPIVDNHRKMTALTEEIGEVAKEVLEAEHKALATQARIRLRTELTQVAAVAIAWLESLEEGK